MEFNVYPHEDNSGDWVVEAIDLNGDGEIRTAIFSGRGARESAEEYANWKQRSLIESRKPVMAAD